MSRIGFLLIFASACTTRPLGDHAMGVVPNPWDGGLDSGGTPSPTGLNFSTQTTLPPNQGITPEIPIAVVTGDFTGDGIDDVAAATLGGNVGPFGVGIFAGQGDGSFGAGGNPRILYSGEGYVWLAAGDIDGDHKLDIVGSNNPGIDGIPSVTLFPQSGGFQSTDIKLATGPRGIRLADLDGAKGDDIVVALDAGDQSLGVIMNQGSGTFAPPAYTALGGAAWDVAAADLNHDGHVDVAVSMRDQRLVAILLGHGDGTLSPPTMYPIAGLGHSATISDVNGDGILDVVVATESTSANDISILIGKGDGTFGPTLHVAAGSGPFFVTTADFDRDGHLDLAVVNLDPSVQILRGHGDGSFDSPRAFSDGQSGEAEAVGDFNRDGLPDLACVGRGGLTVLLNTTK